MFHPQAGTIGEPSRPDGESTRHVREPRRPRPDAGRRRADGPRRPGPSRLGDLHRARRADPLRPLHRVPPTRRGGPVPAADLRGRPPPRLDAPRRDRRPHHAALAPRPGGPAAPRRAAADRGRARHDRPLGRAGDARGRPVGPAGGPRLPRGLDARHPRPRRHDGRGVRGPGRRARRLPLLRPEARPAGGPLGQGDRDAAVVARRGPPRPLLPGRQRGRPRDGRRGRPARLPADAVPRASAARLGGWVLGARPQLPARRPGDGPAGRHRPGDADPLPPLGQGPPRAGDDRPLPDRRGAVEAAPRAPGPAPLRLQQDRHHRGGRPGPHRHRLQGDRQGDRADRRRRPRALPLHVDGGRRHPARRLDARPLPDPPLGLRLAGPLPLRRARPPAGRHPDRRRARLRQLVGEPEQPERSRRSTSGSATSRPTRWARSPSATSWPTSAAGT